MAKLLQLGGHYGDKIPRGWALVDDEDYEAASQFRWSLIDGYAARKDPDSRRLVRLHRWLLGLQPGDKRHSDHINRNRLDNRRINLRVVTQRENNHNQPRRGGTSPYRGVRRCNGGKWQAYVVVDGKFHHLGVYVDEAEAAEVALQGRQRLLPGAVD